MKNLNTQQNLDVILQYFVYDLIVSISLTVYFIRMAHKLSIAFQQDSMHSSMQSLEFDKLAINVNVNGNRNVNTNTNTNVNANATGNTEEEKINNNVDSIRITPITHEDIENGYENGNINDNMDNNKKEKLTDKSGIHDGNNNYGNENSSPIAPVVCPLVDQQLVARVSRFTVLTLCISLSSLFVLFIILAIIVDSDIFWLSYLMISIDCAVNVCCIILCFPFCHLFCCYPVFCKRFAKKVEKFVVNNNIYGVRVPFHSPK